MCDSASVMETSLVRTCHSVEALIVAIEGVFIVNDASLHASLPRIVGDFIDLMETLLFVTCRIY